MSNPRLRLDKIARRSLKNLRKKEDTAAPVAEKCIRDESREESAKRAQRHAESAHAFGTNLLHLFNEELVDFVKKVDDTTYVAVEWPWQATHKLVATSWNTDDKKLSKNAPKLALSVCAQPLKVHTKKTGLVVKKAFPKSAPAYVPTKSVRAKRNVLKFIATAMEAKIRPTLIDRMSASECDLFYHSLIRASRNLHKK